MIVSKRLRLRWSAMLAAAVALPALGATAPKPLYRDPVYDGAADVSTIYDQAQRHWTMFYTNRRATLKFPDPKDVAWVHGTPIGMAISTDGLKWRYKGQAQLPEACAGKTLWAPEMYRESGLYHMWVTVVPGIYSNWNGPRHIVHLTSTDLDHWTCSDRLDLGSDRVIDPSVIRLDNGAYRIWFKDERAGSRIFAADSSDLIHWTRQAAPVVYMAAEGPKVFRFKGYFWMIADAWKGLIVLRSTDALIWTLQADRILETPGKQLTDRSMGHHPDVIVNGGRAFIYFFVQQDAEPETAADKWYRQRSAIQVGELTFKDGQLGVDRDAFVSQPLVRPQ